jgi:23S rRNA (cytidine1920-2'-O)/16S rRNA (cytidine1409-2'-O)-methyltransferase
MSLKKIRLDQLVEQLYPTHSRRLIQSWIMQGKVLVDGVPVTKPGTQVRPDAVVTCNAEEPPYVSRAGFKLAHALDIFKIDVKGLVALDAGLSTGGFTDCLLQRGALKVFGVDVGYGQVHEKIRVDPRVVVLERTNLRDLVTKTLGELVDLVTLDLSFISVQKVLDAVFACMKPTATIIILIKPQFESERHEVGKGGIVKDSAVHERVIQKIKNDLELRGCTILGITDSPILGATGNKEFLIGAQRTR